MGGVLSLLIVGCGGTTEHSPAALKPIEDPPPPAGQGGEAGDDDSCPVAGTWAGRIAGGPFAGDVIRFAFGHDRDVRAVAGPSPVNQTWSLYENVLSVQDRSDSSYTGSCSSGVGATYEIDFGPGCRTIRIVSLEDPCDERRHTMDWLELERAPAARTR